MRSLTFATAFVIVVTTVTAQEERTLTPQDESAIRARYPRAWDVPIAEGSALARLKSRYERRLQKIAETDVEDQSPYPVWFRAYLRDQLEGLPRRGAYQYPRVGAQILEWMLSHPNFEVPSPSPARRVGEAARIVTVGSNVNVTSLDERNSESFVAVDYQTPHFLVAASNNISGFGRQKQFASSDSGATWTVTELPLTPGTSFQSDPALAWGTDGTAWAATLGISNAPTSIQVQVFKSVDRGATWSFVATVSTGNDNDKELMWIDTHPTSPFKDAVYVAWDRPGGGMRFSRSTDKGATWSPVTNLSADGAIGTHLASGPSGELYVAWPDTGSRELRIRKSTDGGATFAPARVIATTNDSFEISIPAMCQRKALVYLSLGVDRSEGPRKGWVYAAWTDRNGTAADPDCAGVASASNANVYYSRSSDGGTTWSPPAVVHTNPANTDQFNQWMDVDPSDGAVYVAFDDTRDDPGRKKTNVYYVVSRDGGGTWVDETRVTTAQTDETVAGADLGNQYGDYNGLAVYRGVASPVWTDRRSGVPGGKEQIFTAQVSPRPTLDLTACVRHPWMCFFGEMIDTQLVLECPVRGCFVLDPLPRNCLVKFNCPGCPPGGLCPPYYHVQMEELDPFWELGLVDTDGAPAPFQLKRKDKTATVSFRPAKEGFLDGQIGDYFLVFRMGREGKPGVKAKVKFTLKVSEEPNP